MEYFVRIKFDSGNKFYNFSCETPNLEVGDKVVVDTVHGLELATVAKAPLPLKEYKSNLALKPILRKAEKPDLSMYNSNLFNAKKAKELFLDETKNLNLDMKLIDTQYTLDGSKLVFTYLADERIDFRELLKILAAKLKCRIELRQIGARERAILYGGLGPCGRPICCSLFLSEFDGISIRKAKNQMLTINASKISGQCGKLLCCLNYEDELYTELKKEFPAIGTKLYINNIEYTVNSYNILSKIVKCTGEGGDVFLPLKDILDIMDVSKKPVKQNKEEKLEKVDQEVKDSSNKKERNQKRQDNRNNKNKRPENKNFNKQKSPKNYNKKGAENAKNPPDPQQNSNSNKNKGRNNFNRRNNFNNKNRKPKSDKPADSNKAE